MPSFDTTSSSSFGPGTLNTSPTIVTWAHNNLGNFIVVFFEEFTGVAITARAATYNGIAMAELGANAFYLSSPPIGNFTISVSLTHSASYAGSGIAYIAASYKLVSIIGQPKNYTDTGNNGLASISSTITLPSLSSWHIGCGFEYANAGGIAGSPSLRGSINIPNSGEYIGIIDSNGGGSYPGTTTLNSSNTSTFNQGSRIASFMVEQFIPLSPGFIFL